MKKSLMFKKAHEIARSINGQVGNYSIAFKLALKRVWKMVKNGRKRFSESSITNSIYRLTHKPRKAYDGPIYTNGVPDWILENNLNQQERQAVGLAYAVDVIKETTKAVLIQWVTDFGNITTWCPKSVFKGIKFNNTKVTDIDIL